MFSHIAVRVSVCVCTHVTTNILHGLFNHIRQHASLTVRVCKVGVTEIKNALNDSTINRRKECWPADFKIFTDFWNGVVAVKVCLSVE